ncbi:SERTA domain-containing protein 2 [Neoarius graeffei]|uniref:SERTA domain-containing protein 2 n=1 Tax=Neoarius graeffei TaxID=443677 RepID=UPI00298CA5BD|nr:SERTA domain-containing protein 2 [Neoarius graeffei]
MGQRQVLSPNASMKGKVTSVYRLDVDSVLKKEVESGQGDALSSARYGLGCGVKRKLSECEDSALDLPYPQQRQLVLDLCLDKLQSCQQQAEPSLHRSVLLANTLRQIQQEMKLEGSDILPPASPSPFPPPTPCHIPDLPPVSGDSSPLLSGPVSSSSLTLGEHSESKPPSLALVEEVDSKMPESLFSTFEITNSTSYLTDLTLDDIFEDIDTSMYDLSEVSVLACSGPRDDGPKSLSNLQLCLTDLSDLDHLLDILVHS